MSHLDLSMVLGTLVDRAASALPQTARQNIFAVSGGRVLLTSLTCTTATALGVAGPITEVGFDNNPSIGYTSAFSSAPTSYVSAGCIFSLVGESGATWSTGGGYGRVANSGFIFPTGDIYYITNVSTTGTLSWSLTYVPIDEGATVTAV